MRIVFFGTDNFARHVLDVLHQHYEIVAVITTPDAKVGRAQLMQESPVAFLAKELQVKVLKPNTLKNNPILEKELRLLNADVFIVVVYGKIIPENILSIAPKGNVNVHPSLLPRYRGPSPIRTPILNGDIETGVSIMLIDNEVDHGPILAQERVKISLDDNNITLTEKLATVAAPLLVSTINGFVQGNIKPKEQEHSQATFTKIITKEDGKINWNKPAQEIYNQFRALYEWPGIWTIWQDKIVKITNCSMSSNTTDASAGTVLAGGKISCGNGTVLQIHSLQLQGKKETDVKSFLNGYKNFIGSTLL